MTSQEINELVEPYENGGLQCDGMTNIISYLLSERKVDHKICDGWVEGREKNITYHVWIVLPDGRQIDYKARMWMGEYDCIPHGVFMEDDYPEVEYVTTMKKEPLGKQSLSASKFIFDSLTLNEKWEIQGV